MGQKYPLHKELRTIAKIKLPINRFMLPIINAAMQIMFRFQSDKNVMIHKYKINGYEDAKIPVYVIEPKEEASEKLPCLVFMHGGGFMLETSDAHIKLAKEYAQRIPCKVVYADYRLAPKHPYPVPVEDCYAAYRWTIEHADQLNIDRNRIAIGGDSAGGNLALAVTLMARDRGLSMPFFDLLIYPVTDRRMTTKSMREYTDTPVWNAKLSVLMWDYYLGSQQIEQIAYASPLEADSFEDFPRTYIEVSEFDCLRDEGIALYERLREAGIDVEFHEVKQACHGFEAAVNSSITRAAMNRRIAYIRKNIM